MQRMHNWWWLVFILTVGTFVTVRVYQLRREHREADAKYGSNEQMLLPKQIVIPSEFMVVVEKEAAHRVQYTYTMDMSGRHNVEELFRRFQHNCPDLDGFLNSPNIGVGSYLIKPDGNCQKKSLQIRPLQLPTAP